MRLKASRKMTWASFELLKKMSSFHVFSDMTMYIGKENVTQQLFINQTLREEHSKEIHFLSPIQLIAFSSAGN